MNDFEIFKRIKNKFQEYYYMEPMINLNSNLEEDLGMDSLDIIWSILDIEDEFNIKIPDEKEFKTIYDIVEYIKDIK